MPGARLLLQTAGPLILSLAPLASIGWLQEQAAWENHRTQRWATERKIAIERTLNTLSQRHRSTIQAAGAGTYARLQKQKEAPDQEILLQRYPRQMAYQIRQLQRLLKIEPPLKAPRSWSRDTARLLREISLLSQHLDLCAESLAALQLAWQLPASNKIETEESTELPEPTEPTFGDAVLEVGKQDRLIQHRLATARSILARILQMPPPKAVPTFLWIFAAFFPLCALGWTAAAAYALSALKTEPNLKTPRWSPLAHHIATKWQRLIQEKDDAIAAFEGQKATYDRHQREFRRQSQASGLFGLYQENLVQSLKAGILVTDPQHRLQTSNRAARKILATYAESFENTDDTQAILAPLATALAAREMTLQSVAQHALAGTQDQQILGLRLDAAQSQPPTSHSEILVDIHLSPFHDESGAVRGLLWVLDDVSERSHLKNQLLGAERLAAVGRLSAKVTHEIRNPLSAIGLNAELLEEEFAHLLPAPAGDEAVQILRALSREIEHLTTITDGYLQLARMPAPTIRPLDLRHLVDDTVATLSRDFHMQNIQTTTQLAAQWPKVLADGGQIRQVLVNVLRNCSEAMSQGGNIIIQGKSVHSPNQAPTSHPHHFALIIEDDGCGIPSDLTSRVFEPFFTTKSGGTGLGLSVSQDILQAHDGEISLKSCAPKPGTQTTLLLPTASTEFA